MKSCNLISKEKLEKNKIKSIDIFNNLKVNYFLQKVSNNLEIKKSFNILKYNNNIKKNKYKY